MHFSSTSFSISHPIKGEIFCVSIFFFGLNNSFILSKTLASSIVLGNLYSSLLIIARKIFRKILPDLVLGNFGTISNSLNAATGPIVSRTIVVASLIISISSLETPLFNTKNPKGISPLRLCFTPVTAHSATSGCFAKTSSIAPVESLCPAVLIISSVRDIIKR